MPRGTARVRWIGLATILFSLFSPFVTMYASAETGVPQPEIVIPGDEGTPTASEPTVEPTLPPTPEPTLAPTLEPTAVPTVEPTATMVPTIEPTMVPTVESTTEPTSEPASIARPTRDRSLQAGTGDTSALQPLSQGMTLSIVPDSERVPAGSPIDFTVTATWLGSTYFGIQFTAPGFAGSNWTFTPENGACDGTGNAPYCYPTDQSAGSFVVRVTSPTTSASCGTHTLAANSNAPAGRLDASGSITVHCEPNVSASVDAPETIVPGDTLSYEVTLANSGSADAFFPFLRATLPIIAGSTWSIDASPGFDCMREGTAVTCNVMTLGIDQSLTATISTDDTDALSCGERLQISAFSSSTGSISETTTVTCPQPNVGITKVPGAATVEVGGTASFTITVSNTGDGTSLPYGLQDLLPAMGDQTSWVITASDFGGLCAIVTEAAGQYLDCFVDALAPNTARSVTIQHAVTGEVCGEIPNTAQLYNADQTLHDSSTATMTVACEPEINLALAGQGSIVPGNPLWFDVTVTNTGFANANDAAFAAALPNTRHDWTVTSITGNGDGNCTVEVMSLRCSGIALPAQVGEFTIRVQSATIASEFSCHDYTIDARMGEAHQTLTTTSTCVADLSIGLAGPETTDSGDALDYFVALANDGLATADDVGFRLDVPAGWSMDEGADPRCTQAGTEVTCEGFQARSGITSTFVIEGNIVLDPELCTTVSATAHLAGAFAGSSEPVETRVSCHTGLDVSLVATSVTSPDGEARDLVSGVQPGDEVTYALTIANTGTMDLTGVTVAEASLAFTCDPATPADVLAPGAEIACSATYPVTEADILAGSITQTARVSTGEFDSYPVSAIVITAQASPSLTVETAVPGVDEPVREGDEIIFTFTITTTGNLTISDVALETSLAGLVLDNAGTARVGTMAFTQVDAGARIGDLAPGEAATVRASYTVTAADVAVGSVRNVATVTGTSTDETVISARDEFVIDVAQPAATPTPGPTVTPAPTIPATPESPVTPNPTPTVEPASGQAATPEATASSPAITINGLPSTGSAGTTDGSGAWWMAAIVAIAVVGIGIGVRRRAV